MIPSHTWVAIKKKGLLPEIDSPETYLQKTLQGSVQAAQIILETDTNIPKLSTLTALHKKIFEETTPWAGKVTKSQLITNGYPTCEPGRIKDEFQKLEKQWSMGFVPNAHPQEKIRWAAFAAARILRIHPFIDGNKRTISIWTLGTLIKELGDIKLDDPNRWKTLHNAFKDLRQGNLKPFGEGLLQTWELEIPKDWKPNWDSPHKVAPKFTPDLTPEI